jgi:acyl-CoA hydrolase
MQAPLPILRPRKKRGSWKLILPKPPSNHCGTLFGGRALSLMGKAAHRARRTVVVAASDRIDFHVPVNVDHFVELERALSGPDARR